MTPDYQTLSHPIQALPVRIIIPVALTIVLFILTIFLFILPKMESFMMDGKRETTRHLTETAWSVLDYFHGLETSGDLSSVQAKEGAVALLEQLRYGEEYKDYFWINDTTPTMIMHPYRPDLEGRDVSDFTDPAGNPLFADMVKIAKTSGAGFVDYLWQWQADADHIVPKISHVKVFDPWGWIIGTGIYVADVKADISAVTRKITLACAGIMGVVLVLSGYIVWAAAGSRKARLAAQARSDLQEKQLVQADKMASLGILVAGVAHEVNNPATTLMLNAPNLKKSFEAFLPLLDVHFARHPDTRVCNMAYPDLRARIEQMLVAILDASTRIKTLISDLKDFSRPADTRTPFPDPAIDVNQVVKKALDLTHPVLKKITPHVSAHYGRHLPRVSGDFQKLIQVVINLLTNAAQALENREQAITVTTSTNRHQNIVTIAVTDTGPGVTPEKLDKLTGPFYTTRRDEGGTGLGLFISEKIVSDMLGVLELESDPGRGLTARIVLPCAEK
ncbi:MAG TPA: cache domain-containing protein [Desulfotignum sp.]|nr:cache domain-containing protein [Desulfotignum sp.]